MVLWTLDAGQKRRRLVDASFAPAFYVGGPLDEIARLTPQLPAEFPVRLDWVERQDIWSGDWQTGLEVGGTRLARFAEGGRARPPRRAFQLRHLFARALRLRERRLPAGPLRLRRGRRKPRADARGRGRPLGHPVRAAAAHDDGVAARGRSPQPSPRPPRRVGGARG